MADAGEAQTMDALGIESRYLMIDVGANLTNKKYQRDLDQVVQRARDAGRRRRLGRASASEAWVYPGADY